MSSPQVENGYTRIANELLEAILRYRSSGAQKDIILAVIRATYGFHRKSRAIGTAYLAKLTGRHPRRVGADVAELIRRKVLTEVRPYRARTCRTLALNKNFDEWIRKDECTKPLTVSETAHSECTKPLIVSERNRSPKKETIKDTLKDTGSPDGSPSPNHQNKSSESVPPVRAFETWWAAEYRRRFRENYLFNYGKEGKLIKAMLKACNLERLKLIASTFLDSSDNFTKDAGHTIGILYTRFNALNAKLNGTRSGETKPAGPTETQKILMQVKV